MGNGSFLLDGEFFFCCISFLFVHVPQVSNISNSCLHEFNFFNLRRTTRQDPDGKIENSGKKAWEKQDTELLFIQVIVFDLSYLPVAAVGISQVRNHEKSCFPHAFSRNFQFYRRNPTTRGILRFGSKGHRRRYVHVKSYV